MQNRVFDSIKNRLEMIEQALRRNDKEDALRQVQLLQGYIEGVEDNTPKPYPGNVLNR